MRSVELELQTKMVELIPFYFRPDGPGTPGPPIHFHEGAPPPERTNPQMPQRPQGPKRYRKKGPDRTPFFTGGEMTARGEMNKGNLHKGLREEGFYFYAEDGEGKTLHQTDNPPDELLPVSQLTKEMTNWDFVNTDTQFFTIQTLPGRGILVMGQPRSIWADQFDALMLKLTLLCFAS